MTLFFTADLHLGHERINELAGRPFTRVDEGDAALIERWNARVAPGDDVFILGDVCMGKLVDSLALAKTLNGVKHLVPGNHDRVSYLYRGSPAKKLEWRMLYDWAGFRVKDDQLQFFPIGDDISVDLCHFPYEGDSHGEDRYVDARPHDDGRWLLHGHVHEAWKVRDRQVNVGVDVWSFAPVSEDEVVEVIAQNS